MEEYRTTPFKLRFYWKKGKNKGNVRTEEHFETLEELAMRYTKMFRREDYSLNPTAWFFSEGEWRRILDSDIRDAAMIANESEIKEVVICDEDIDNVLSAALEGGISYWCKTADIVGDLRGIDGSPAYSSSPSLGGEVYLCEHVLHGGTLKLKVPDNDSPTSEEEYSWLRLDKEELQRGIRLWLEKTFNRNTMKTVTYRDDANVLRLDLALVDAEMADAIVQYALFGELVFS